MAVASARTSPTRSVKDQARGEPANRGQPLAIGVAFQQNLANLLFQHDAGSYPAFHGVGPSF